MEQFPKIFVLHVKTGYEDRARHIEKMIAKLGLPFEYVLDGDMGDLTPEGMDRFFAPPMNTVSAATSCGMKHLLAYERIENECPNGAIVLEDDIFLNRRFLEILPRSIRQAREFSGEKPFWIGYEATCLKFIPRSRRKKGIVVYPADEIQCAGAYYVTQECAALLRRLTSEQKCSVPYDWFVTSLHRQGGFDIYWTHPVTAVQGTHTGRMPSSIGNSVDSQWRLWVRVKRPLTAFFKQFVNWFR